MKNQVFELAQEFSAEPHGRTNYDKDNIFVMGGSTNEFVPFSYLQKKTESIESVDQLLSIGFIFSSYVFQETDFFEKWFESQFSKKLIPKRSSDLSVLHWPNHKEIFDAVHGIHQYYESLRDSFILINGKNLPVQLGEWYTKVIFGLKQRKSTSQRGFDFHLGDHKIEVKIEWADQSSPKGVKLKKSLVSLSDSCIIMYISRDFMIRDICYLDSEFVARKFTGKGHTIFLKDSDISQYFFSRSDKHLNKVINKTALMKFAQPALAMKLDGRF